MRNELALGCSLLLVLCALPHAGRAGEIRFPGYSHGQLVANVPEAWSGELTKQDPRVAEMEFKGGGAQDLTVVISVVMPPFGRDSGLSPAALRRSIQEYADQVASEYHDSHIVVQDYRSPGTYGSYFSSSNPKAAKGRSYITQGAVVLGEVAVHFTAHGYSDPEGIRAAVLSVVRSFKLAPAEGAVRGGK